MPDIDPDLPGTSLVTVYEAINETRREIFIGLSSYFMNEIEARVRKRPELAHWQATDRTRVDAIEYGIPLSVARDFLKRFETAKANEGWKILSSPELDTAKAERRRPPEGKAAP